MLGNDDVDFIGNNSSLSLSICAATLTWRASCTKTHLLVSFPCTWFPHMQHKGGFVASMWRRIFLLPTCFDGGVCMSQSQTTPLGVPKLNWFPFIWVNPNLHLEQGDTDSLFQTITRMILCIHSSLRFLLLEWIYRIKSNNLTYMIIKTTFYELISIWSFFVRQ